MSHLYKAGDFLRLAAQLVSGDREKTHGRKITNFGAIADMWNGYLAARKKWGKPDELDAHDVAMMMAAMKMARTLGGSFNADDFVDGAGYFACGGEIRRDQISASWVEPAEKPKSCTCDFECDCKGFPLT
jgi:hypothetical protein